jgi:hypothetical protein
MKYILMICNDESVILSPTEVHALPQIQAWDAEVDARVWARVKATTTQITRL